MSKKKKVLLPYVSRGGLKLEHALKTLEVKVDGKIAIDVGASTGGFTDCLLKRGAAKIYAIDVGYGQLAWKLQKDPRVIRVDRTNIRYLTPEKLYKESEEKADIATIDVSFISLAKVLPAVYNLIKDDGEIISLVKPQFEAPKELVEPGGLITDKAVQKEVLKSVYKEAKAAGLNFLGAAYSPVKGANGNIEYFLYLAKKKGKSPGSSLENIVEEANSFFGEGKKP